MAAFHSDSRRIAFLLNCDAKVRLFRETQKLSFHFILINAFLLLYVKQAQTDIFALLT